jgi:single-strand DNA-binding protein
MLRRIMLSGGNIVKDAEAKSINGSNVILFTVCLNEKYKDKNGNKVDKPHYYDCMLWKEDDNALTYLKKGVKIYIEGTPEVNMWTDKEGVAKASIKVRVTLYDIQVYAPNPNNNASTTSQSGNSTNNSMQSNNDFQNQGVDKNGLPF